MICQKMRRISLAIIVGVMVGYTPVRAAAFSTPSSLINIPIAEYFKSGDVEFGASTGVNSANTYEFDFMLNYALTEQFKVGVTLINYDTLVGNIHATFFRLKRTRNLTVAAGLTNISSNSDLSTWENFDDSRSVNFAHYLVASFDFKGLRMHTGIGKRKIETPSGGGATPAGFSAFVGNAFIGANKDFGAGEIMVEYDGSELNFGYRYKFNDKTTGRVAMTQLGASQSSGSSNPAPSRFLSMGVLYTHNLFKFYDDEFNVLRQELTEKKDELSKELAQLKAEREASQGIATANDDALTQAFLHYQRAFDYYRNRDYTSALTEMETAVDLAPKDPNFQAQLGTIYYRIGNGKKALESWTKAYELDPNSREIRKLPPRVLSYIKKKANS